MAYSARIAMERQEILVRLRERIVSFAASRVSRDIAEDLAQETLLLLTQKYASVERLEDLVPLSFRIVRFKMTARWRKSVRRGETTAMPVDELSIADDAPSPEDLAERRQLRDRLAAGIAKLDGRCREIFRLKLEGKTFAEMREALGANTVNTVFTWDHRCRQRLRELMGGSWSRGQ